MIKSFLMKLFGIKEGFSIEDFSSLLKLNDINFDELITNVQSQTELNNETAQEQRSKARNIRQEALGEYENALAILQQTLTGKLSVATEMEGQAFDLDQQSEKMNEVIAKFIPA